MTEKSKGLADFADKPLTVTTLDCPAVIAAGLKLHVPVLQVRSIVPWNVDGAAAVMVNVVDLVPIRMTLDLALAESEKTAFPVPERFTACGLLVASSLTVNDPDRVPVVVGVNVTLTVHAAPTLRTVGRAPQVFVSAKSPVTSMLLIFIAVLPVLTNWTVCGELVCPTV